MLKWRHVMTASNPLLRALRVVACCTLAAASTSGLAAQAQCTMERLADIAVTMLGNEPLIAASINGHPSAMLLDTGAARRMIWRSSARELDLSIGQSGVRMYGVDGRDVTGVVSIRDFGLSGAMAHNILMLAAGSGDAPKGSVGLLGEDVISSWDLDIDLSAGRLRLYRP